jgi:hypothetical protein
MNTFNLLEEYLSKRRHMCEPVMTIIPLLNESKAKKDEITSDLMQNDLTILNYFSELVKQKIGEVMRRSKNVSKEKKTN